MGGGILMAEGGGGTRKKFAAPPVEGLTRVWIGMDWGMNRDVLPLSCGSIACQTWGGTLEG